MLKKFLILIILILFSSSLIYGANCYTSATVESSALIKIVNGEEALIGIPSTLHVQEETIYETVKKGNIIPLEVEANTEIEQHSTLEIKKDTRIIETDTINNMSETIYEAVDSGSITSSEIEADAEAEIPSTLVVKEVRKFIETQIINNMSETMYVTMDNGNITSSKVEANTELGIRIEPGEQVSVQINLDNYQVDRVIFHATWNNNAGEAYITSSIQ